MTFAQLRTFLEVARHGSIRGAASARFITEPSVSAAVASLEKELKVELFERVGRGIRATPAGEELARQVGELLGLQARAVRLTQEAAGRPRSLRLAAVTTAAEYVLPPYLKAFRTRLPEVELRLEVGNRATVIESLLTHRADLGVGGRPPDEGGIVGEPFLTNRLLVVAAAEHPLAGARTIEPEQLSGETWLMREAGSGTRHATEEFLFSTGSTDPTTMTLGSNGAVKQAAALGMGVTLVSEEAVKTELAAGTLARLRVRGTPVVRAWHVLRLDEREPGESAARFLRLLRARRHR
jgi:LysR family transcriptional regulator, low CO2-responsive transcriptional regulator